MTVGGGVGSVLVTGNNNLRHFNHVSYIYIFHTLIQLGTKYLLRPAYFFIPSSSAFNCIPTEYWN